MGAIYSLVAMAVVLLYNASGMDNFASGEFLMLGGMFIYTFHELWHLPLWTGWVLTLACMALFGLLFEVLVYSPLKSREFLPIVCTFIGASILIKNIALNVWGPVPKPFPDMFGGKLWSIGEVMIVPQNVFILCVAVFLVCLLYYLFYRTLVGKKMRAVAQDLVAARLMGINVEKSIAFSFAVSSLLGGIAGILLAPIFFVDLEMGTLASLFAFSASVIGGYGSIPGAIVGGLMLGIIETFVAFYVSSQYKVAISFTILIVFLLFKPKGIFGESVSKKA